MWSKTWAIALAILSRLTVTDCLGPPLHRAYPAAHERIQDPDGEIDDAYRMREELTRENLLKHLKLPSAAENSISATEIEYADDESGLRHRYYGNKHLHHSHSATNEKSKEIRNSHDQEFSERSFQGSKDVPANRNHHHHQQHRHDATKDQSSELGPDEDKETEQDVGYVMKSEPNVQIRSGIESFQPIAAAIAMQNLKALEDASINSPPPPPPQTSPPIHPPKHYPFSDHEVKVELEQPIHPKIAIPTDSKSIENDVLRPEHGSPAEIKAASKEIQAALRQTSIKEKSETASLTEVYFLAVIAGCSVAGFMGLVLAGVCYYRLRKKVKAASDVEYPAYGVTGPIKEREGGAPGDRKLAQSAQMYHYQHQKQQMIASERLNSDVNHRGASDAESEDENEEGDYTVFECPGLATNGDMEVRNPLFSEQTPVTAPSDLPGTQGKK